MQVRNAKDLLVIRDGWQEVTIKGRYGYRWRVIDGDVLQIGDVVWLPSSGYGQWTAEVTGHGHSWDGPVRTIESRYVPEGATQ